MSEKEGNKQLTQMHYIYKAPETGQAKNEKKAFTWKVKFKIRMILLKIKSVSKPTKKHIGTTKKNTLMSTCKIE